MTSKADIMNHATRSHAFS